MEEVHGHKKNLPYGLPFTRIFRHFGVVLDKSLYRSTAICSSSITSTATMNSPKNYNF